MAAHPLTHHEILGLIGPYTREGRQLDIGGSDRIGRRLVFKPIAHPGDVVETLQLENPEPMVFRLMRVLQLGGGLEARLSADGSDPAELLARIADIPPARQFSRGTGFMIAWNHGLDAGRHLSLSSAHARVDGLIIDLRPLAENHASADVLIKPAGAEAPRLPADLLAVLGWKWRCLKTMAEGWESGFTLRGREPQRSRRAEQAFEAAVRHVAGTLEGPPAHFHERWLRARWAVTLRRALPLLACLALIAGAIAVPKLPLAENSAWRMLIFNAPPLLLVLVFCLREIPTVEIPPLPRRPRESDWRTPPNPIS